MIKNSPPPNTALQAFGASETPIQLSGGQGENFQSGNIVFKPAEKNEETDWIANFYLNINCDGFQVPKPIRSDKGDFVFDGWLAYEYIEGQHKNNHWIEIIDICTNFHKSIKDFPKPSYFDKREQNPWVIADKVTWDELEYDFHPKIKPSVEKLQKRLRPVYEKSQLIHGDFGGNVLFSENQPPAVIDFSPYFRPMEFAISIVVADAIVWEGADFSLIKAGNKFNNFYQHLVRAELRRVIELDTSYRISGRDILDEINAHLPFIEEICNQ